MRTYERAVQSGIQHLNENAVAHWPSLVNIPHLDMSVWDNHVLAYSVKLTKDAVNFMRNTLKDKGFFLEEPTREQLKELTDEWKLQLKEVRPYELAVRKGLEAIKKFNYSLLAKVNESNLAVVAQMFGNVAEACSKFGFDDLQAAAHGFKKSCWATWDELQKEWRTQIDNIYPEAVQRAAVLFDKYFPDWRKSSFEGIGNLIVKLGGQSTIDTKLFGEASTSLQLLDHGFIALNNMSGQERDKLDKAWLECVDFSVVVAKGANFLDKKAPGWADNIDPEKLQMHSSTCDITGQLRTAKVCDGNSPSLIDYGHNITTFCTGLDDYRWRMLEKKWKEAIAKRTKPKGNPYVAVVKAGIEHLDKNYPNWINKIDTDILDMHYTDKDVIGQLGKQHMFKLEEKAALGFTLDTKNQTLSNWNILTEEWKRQINEHIPVAEEIVPIAVPTLKVRANGASPQIHIITALESRIQILENHVLTLTEQIKQMSNALKR